MEAKKVWGLLKKSALSFVVGTLPWAMVQNSWAHTCPGDATATGLGVTVAALRTNGVPIGTSTVAPCEPIIVQMSVVYFPVDPITGGKNAAFEMGEMILKVKGITTDVTPPGGVPLIGGDGTVGCNGVNFFRSLQLPYTVTEADAMAGSIPILALYTNGNAHIGADLVGVVSGSQGFMLRVRPPVSCAITPQTNVICAGGSGSFTASATDGTGPYTFTWTGPGGFSASGPTIIASNAGVYIATARDFYGCTNTCQARLIVNPSPTCTIAGPDSILCPPTGSQTTTVYTSTVNPAGGTGTHSWSLSGSACASIQGPTNGASVTVLVDHSLCASGSFTLTDNITRDGCPGQCTKTVRIDCPGIRVWKQVVCYTNGVCEPFSADLDTQKSASGVRLDPPNAANCPAFCYRITVRNTGSVPLTLTVSDPDLNLSACGFPSVLAAGATAQCIVPAVTRCANEQNVVVATGVTDQNITVVARDTNNVTVTPIAVVCQLLVSTNGGASFFHPGAACPQVMIGSSYIVRISVSNPGQYPLQNVTVASASALGGCLPSPLNLGTLAVTETKTSDCTFTCTVAGRNNYAVSVIAEASKSAGPTCDFNAQGQRIVARSQCQACVECFAQQQGCCVFLLIDEDCIDNTTPGYSLPPNTGRKVDFEGRGKTFTDRDVNDDRPRLAQRVPLRFFNNPTNFGRTIILRSGQISDEGLFALKEYPNSWNLAGPTSDGLLNFRGQPCEPFPHGVGPGLGTGNNPEILLDKIPRVTPLRATGLSMLVGQLVCALVWDSDISINYKPLNGNLQGEKLGVVAFRLLEIKQAIGFSSSSLPLLTIEIVDPCEAFSCVPSLFLDAPEPTDSSDPFDIIPPGGQPVITALAIDPQCNLSCATERNRSYTVEYTDSLINPNWKVLTRISGTGSIIVIPDHNRPAQRFYRLVR